LSRFAVKKKKLWTPCEFLREKAVLMFQAAVEAEAEEFVARFADRRDELGRRQVVRNGYLPQRETITGIGALSVSMRRVRDQSNEALRFRSSLVPACVRRAKRWIPCCRSCYLKGIAAGETPSAASVGKPAPCFTALEPTFGNGGSSLRRRNGFGLTVGLFAGANRSAYSGLFLESAASAIGR
jgi:hypothetical protein